jgi:alpha-glucosidase
VQNTTTGLCADLTLAGSACNIYGNDIANLILKVEYQSQERLSVRIFPKFLDSSNSSLYHLDSQFVSQPAIDEGYDAANPDLEFTWSNSPTFTFKVTRRANGEVLFDTSGTKLVFEDQFLELSTSMVDDYNIYGLAESLHSFRLGTNWTQTFWASYNLDNDNVIDVNGHSTHPMYLETRYDAGGGGYSCSHGVYARNAHGQDWLLRTNRLTYRTIGGSFDLYFLSGDKPKSVIAQYHTQIIGTPYLQPYWTLGFMQVRWGYQNWTNLQEVIDLYADAGIQLEMIANDLDYLYLNRLFTTDNERYNLEEGKAFLDRLHANGQYYFPILDPNVYVPNSKNDTDSYPPYDRGLAQNAFIQDGEAGPYYGVLWSGIAAYVDHVTTAGQQYWADEIVRFSKMLDFDGFWLDVNDATSFCTGSCGSSMLDQNPIHVPFALPGDPNSKVAVSFDYPEMFNVTNSTEAASASAQLASQSSAYPMTATLTTTHARTSPTPGIRQLNFPPYAIKNDAVPGNSLLKQVISPNATHNDRNHLTEYDIHNLYGHMSSRSTFEGLRTAKPGVRPFVLSRSTFAGTGTFAGHWGGDTASTWGNMYFGIGQALAMSIAGIPYFGVETCGFRGNADMELCTRWMQLSAWYPLYRNHNSRNTIAQEAYRWSTTAEATRRIMNIRYSLLPYTYTLFHHANTKGETVLRALSWEFPNDVSLRAVETQFMSGPSILVTPVLAPLATTVQGVFPGIVDGQLWYDWYTLEAVQAGSGENKTLEAPLEHQPIHIRGGSIIPMQAAQNTTATSRASPWSLLVALDKDGFACGDLYLDDGVSISPQETSLVDVSQRERVHWHSLIAAVQIQRRDALFD